MSVSLSPSDLDAIRRLIEIVQNHNLSELTYTLESGLSITIKTPQSEPIYQASYTAAAQNYPPLLPSPSEPAHKASKGIAVTSPMVGIYYQSPAPGEPAFVGVGDLVRVGQTIGLIEAMKVFSEIPSEVSGRVTEVLVGNGVLVQLGQPLMYLQPA